MQKDRQIDKKNNQGTFKMYACFKKMGKTGLNKN